MYICIAKLKLLEVYYFEILIKQPARLKWVVSCSASRPALMESCIYELEIKTSKLTRFIRLAKNNQTTILLIAHTTTSFKWSQVYGSRGSYYV